MATFWAQSRLARIKLPRQDPGMDFDFAKFYPEGAS